MTNGNPQFPNNSFDPAGSQNRQPGQAPEPARKEVPPDLARFYMPRQPQQAQPAAEAAEPDQPDQPARESQALTAPQPGRWRRIRTRFLQITAVLAAAVIGIWMFFSSVVKRQNEKSTDIYKDQALKKFLDNRGKAPDPLALQAKSDKKISTGAFTIVDNRAKTFKPRVERALEMIWRADRTVFFALKRYVYVIRMGDVTDFKMENGVPTIVMTGRTAFRSETWCAGAIAHQLFVAMNYVAQQREQKRKTLPAGLAPAAPSADEAVAIPVDYSDLDSIEFFEKKADAFQYKIMLAIDAPGNELNAIRNRAPHDYSYTHDGIYQPGQIGK
ncbi:MAG: hypothetical protein PHW69_02955 [Elusimicrobiaceae bacterium]|nr:hypothetical protein [Elusimicrobiaceae bacterium]